jgi:lipoprotein-releasing system ATP-binding protein
LGTESLEILKGINLAVHKGEMTVLTGISGVGKSTLLHILGGLEHPTSGEVMINGDNLYTIEERKRCLIRNQRIGFVFQFHHLMPEFSAEENCMFPLLINGDNFVSAREKARNMLDRVGLTHRIEHRPGELSGGELQRAAVARALVMEPDIVLADEPTGNLDEETGDKLYNLLWNLNEERKNTFLIVTHNRNLANKAHRHFVLSGGRLSEK